MTNCGYNSYGAEGENYFCKELVVQHLLETIPLDQVSRCSGNPDPRELLRP